MTGIDLQNNGQGNSIEHPEDAILDNVKITFIGNGNTVRIGRSCLSNVVIEIHGDDNVIEFDEDCCVTNAIIKAWVDRAGRNAVKLTRTRIGRGVQYSQGQIILGGDCVSVEIGEGTNIIEAKLFAVERHSRIEIGPWCLFSWNIEIRTSDWHPIFDIESGQRINMPAPVRLAERVWVGSDVRILKGVTVGAGSVIGVGSIVTRDIPASCVAVGNPARVVRTGISWSVDALSHLDQEPVIAP